MPVLRSGFYGLLCSRETLQVVTVLTPALWATECHLTFCIRICLLQWKGCSTLKWNSGRIFPGFNSRDQTLMIPRAFSSVLEKYECKYQEERTATLESLFSKQLELFMFPEMSSVGQRMVLITPRLEVWSPSGAFSEELELMIYVVPSISKYFESVIMFNFLFVSLSHENQISIKYWPEALNVSASALKKGLNLYPEK